MLKRLTEWTISLAGRKSARYWLGFIAFVENSVFVIPADVLFVPMSMVKPHRAWHYALIATVFSVLGGIAGWLLGFYAYEALARPIVEFYGKVDSFDTLRNSASFELILLLMVTSGLSHVPPIKIVTILAGVVGLNLWLFILLALITRGLRFCLLAFILQRYGTLILAFVLRRLTFIVITASILLLGAWIIYKFMI